MSKINATISLDENLKEDAETLFNELGLDLNTAIVIFLKQSVHEKRIPFSIRRVKPPYAYEMHPPREASQFANIINGIDRHMG